MNEDLKIVRTVTGYVMRHGDRLKDAEGKGLDELSEAGFAQVARSADCHLKGVKIVKAVYSGANRAKQTVETALNNIGMEGRLPVHMHQGFNFNAHDEDVPSGDMLNHLYNHPPKGAEILSNWFAWAPQPTFFLRGQVTLALIMTGEHMLDGEAFLAGSHSPTGELAAPDLAAVGRMNVADIIKYAIGYDEQGFGHVLTAEHLLCPPVDDGYRGIW